jgi:hypothetical protein
LSVSGTAATADTARVEIDIFSGRPNPSFQLDQAATAELLKLLDNSKRGAGAAPRDGLGFRGFVVRIEGRPDIRVSGTTVVSGAEELTDPTRAVERFLLSKMPDDVKRQFSDVLPR